MRKQALISLVALISSASLAFAQDSPSPAPDSSKNMAPAKKMESPSASDKAPGQVKKSDDKDKKPSDHEQIGSDRREPPANWHRYDRRPDDWSTRGCIMFGPVWWCP
jgi:hypothetical protein